MAVTRTLARMPTPKAAALLGAASLALVACTAPSAGSTPPPSSGTTSSTTSTAPDPTTSSTPPPPEEITLAFAGDVHFATYLAPMASDPTALSTLKSTLGAADLSMVNLETTLTDATVPEQKIFTFRAPASALETVAGAGVDVVSMANNHGVDYGLDGLADTLAAKENGPIPIVGIGANADEAFAPAEFTVGDVSIAVFGTHQLYEETLANFSADEDSGGVASSAPPDRIAQEVREAAEDHDLVVVYLHWGLDYQTCPAVGQVNTATVLEEAGADVIVGSHSHRVNGAGWLDRAYVAYGLGNFVWWRSQEPDSRSGVLTLTIDAEAARSTPSTKRTEPLVTDAEWTPMLIGTDGIPREPASDDATRLLDLWNDARACTGLRDAP